MHHAVRLALPAVAITLVAACAERTRLPAQGEVFSDTLIVYALSGTDVSYPTALSVRGLAVVRATGVFNYEIAFDIDAAGQVVLKPVATLVAEEASPRRVGLQKVPGTFESLTMAPRTGYIYDKTMTVSPGEVVAVEASTPCQYPYPQIVFAKLVVDSANVVTRAIHIRAVSDPSCGFRSLVPGEIPRS